MDMNLFSIKLELLQYGQKDFDQMKESYIGQLVLKMDTKTQRELLSVLGYHIYHGNTLKIEISIHEFAFYQRETLRYFRWYSFLNKIAHHHPKNK
jgi:hypothetical protein